MKFTFFLDSFMHIRIFKQVPKYFTSINLFARLTFLYSSKKKKKKKEKNNFHFDFFL
jgi:hypothetical protein